MILISMVLGENEGPEINKLSLDENLIKRIGEGDMEAFEEFYSITERSFYAYLLSLTRNHDLTLDIMQDSYVKLLSAAHLYRARGKPLAWLFTIGKNIFYGKLRKDSRLVNYDSQLLANDINYSHIENKEDRLLLELVLKRLSQEERKIVLLYAISGMRHKEIAEILGLKLSTSLSKYHRALDKLRSYLGEEV